LPRPRGAGCGILHHTPRREAKIAAAHAISVRQLYRLFEGRELGLEATITDLRLLATRSALASSGARAHSIAAIASEGGFSNPSYFADRFRRRFGVTPRQWRDQHHAPALVTSAH
jgi:AraC-like DNA-binding protein